MDREEIREELRLIGKRAQRRRRWAPLYISLGFLCLLLAAYVVPRPGSFWESEEGVFAQKTMQEAKTLQELVLGVEIFAMHLRIDVWKENAFLLHFILMFFAGATLIGSGGSNWLDARREKVIAEALLLLMAGRDVSDDE